MARAPEHRKYRLHLEQRDGTFRQAAQLVFTGRDASLYLIPYAARGTYFYGEQTLAPGQPEAVIKFREQLSADKKPKLSIHESGRVHIYADDGPKAGPVRIPRLTDFRGQHIATVRWDRINLLPVNTARMKVTGEQRDYAFGVPDDIEAGQLLIYVNGEREAFVADQIHFSIPVYRQDGPPVWFGVLAVASDVLGDAADAGVTVLGAFDPRVGPGDEARLLFLRGL